MSITTAIHSWPDVPASVRQFWSRRAMEQDPPLALVRSPEWFDMMTQGATGDALVIVAERSGQVVAALPCQVIPWHLSLTFAGRGIAKKPLTVLKVWGGDLFEEQLGLDELEALVCQVFEQHAEWDGLLLEHVEHGPRLELMRAATAHSHRLRFHLLSSGRPHYRLALPDTYAEFLNLRSSKSVSKVFGRERAMERAHGSKCELVEFRLPSDWEPHAGCIEELMADAWQAHALGHTFSVADMQTVAEHGWNRSFMLKLGDQPVAFAFCYEGMRTLTYAQIGYDPSLGRYSPGVTLLYRLIERLYEAEPPAYLDFGEGEGEYKKQLANDVVHAASVLLTRRSAGLTALFSIHHALSWTDAKLRSFVQDSPIGRRLRHKRRGRG
jgi:hypothetical protein